MEAALGILCLLLVANFRGNLAMDKLKLSSGHEIPVIGLGTSSIKLHEMDQAITSALDNGYRHIDTAFMYENEAAIGKALKKFFNKGGKREELFITSKLPPQGNKPENVEKYLKHSLKDLGFDYVDMYLIHVPFGLKEGRNLHIQKVNEKEILESVDHVALWKAMEQQVKSGRAKSIGLSNFNETQVLNIYNNAEIKPSNLQVESHAYLQQKRLRQFCKEHNIVMTAYAPLGSQSIRASLYGGTEKNLPPLVELPLINQLANKYRKSPSQILLKHTIQDGLAAIPKSSNAGRQKINIDLFDFKLTNDEMQKIRDLDQGEKGRVFDFTNFYEGLDKHPQNPFGGKA